MLVTPGTTANAPGLFEAARFASAAAALSVTKRGAQPSMPRREEVEALLGPGS
jgi:sugar/nucleoside kinase (ribokinase family)